jgi:hypothetical protein
VESRAQLYKRAQIAQLFEGAGRLAERRDIATTTGAACANQPRRNRPRRGTSRLAAAAS